MHSILNLTKTNKLILAAFAFLAVLTFGGGRAHAATLNVSVGCTLAEAIDSVNNSVSEPGCSEIGTYGTSDAINIPAGTITLAADMPAITKPVNISGAGADQTTISGDNGQYRMFKANSVGGLISISDLKITAYDNAAVDIEATDSDITLTNIDVDGSDSFGGGIYINLFGTSQTTFTSNGIYVHDINWSADDVYAFSISKHDTNSAVVNASNTTIANITTSGSNMLFGFGLSAGTGGSGTGTLTANITNTTVDNLNGDNFVAPFYALSFGSGGNTSVIANVTYVTITNIAGSSGSIAGGNIDTAAFFALAAGALSGNVGTATINVRNSLFSNNTADGTSNNCGSLDLTSLIGGSGTGSPSINSLGHNISDDATCANFNQTGDKQNINNILSTLGPLQNNGGDVPTRALLAGSPAIVAGGQVLGVTTDARGVARPASCPSVGAFQYEGAVCAANTNNANVGVNVAAPNTGIGPASVTLNILAGLIGLGSLGYAIRRRIAVK